jgi:hypothetical protein
MNIGIPFAKARSPKKNIMRSFKMAEISAVDRPAQAGALAVLAKRNSTDPVADLAKATFQEALDGQLLATRVSEIFYRSFDGLWARNDAFRCALIDELAEGGDGTKASEDYLASVRTLIESAVATARETGADATDEQLAAAVEKAASTWLQTKETTMFKTRAELLAAIAKFQTGGGTQAEIDLIKSSAVHLKAEDALPAGGALAKVAADPALVDLQKRFERSEKVNALSGDVRKHFDGLGDDAARDAFLALDPTAQAAEVSKAAGPDPVVYTTIDGVAIHKSDGATVLSLAKSADNAARENAKLVLKLNNASFEKRANEDLGKLGGTTDTRIALLKAVDGIEDEATRTAVLDTLRSANKAASGAFERRGTTAGGGANLGKADGSGGEQFHGTEGGDLTKAADRKLDEEVRKRMTAAGETGEASYSKHLMAFCNTPEGRQLYAESAASEG